MQTRGNSNEQESPEREGADGLPQEDGGFFGNGGKQGMYATMRLPGSTRAAGQAHNGS
jgi:hypothetical protein